MCKGNPHCSHYENNQRKGPKQNNNNKSGTKVKGELLIGEIFIYSNVGFEACLLSLPVSSGLENLLIYLRLNYFAMGLFFVSLCRSRPRLSGSRMKFLLLLSTRWHLLWIPTVFLSPPFISRYTFLENHRPSSSLDANFRVCTRLWNCLLKFNYANINWPGHTRENIFF